MTITDTPILTKKDFQSDQEVRWCPGCGDYAILSAVQATLPTLGLPREKFVVVSGIGCSSRFPYYMDTYGFHTIHGRAPGVATGLKLTRPDLQVWVVTGDGDALSIGGNHFIHMLRRNVGLKVLLFNNRIYGLTKGQYSPTSEVGKRTKSSPLGSLDAPFDPLSVALGCGATFVARSVDIFQPHLKSMLKRAAEHEGTAFIEIFQNCNIFNDHAFTGVTEKSARKENVLYIEDGKPLIFGAENRRGIRRGTTGLEVVDLPEGADESEIIVWDESAENPSAAFELSQLEAPEFPVPLGVLRAVQRPVYEQQVIGQIRAQEEAAGDASLENLLHSGDTWVVS